MQFLQTHMKYQKIPIVMMQIKTHIFREIQNLYAASSSSMLQKYPLKSDDTLTINIHSADNTQLFFISFDIFLLINGFEFPATEF